MKKSASLIAIALMFSLFFSACNKSYECKCTYVARSLGSAAGQPNKEESVTIKAKMLSLAESKCAMHGDKYFSQGYDGTCTVQ